MTNEEIRALLEAAAKLPQSDRSCVENRCTLTNEEHRELREEYQRLVRGEGK